MLRLGVASLVATVAIGVVSANESAQIEALRREIRTLRASENASIEALRARYHFLIKHDRWSETELAKEREVLRHQEREMLALASNDEQRNAIRERYAFLIGKLNRNIRWDAKQIAELRGHEDAHIRHIRAAYGAKIRALEATIHQLAGTGGHAVAKNTSSPNAKPKPTNKPPPAAPKNSKTKTTKH